MYINGREASAKVEKVSNLDFSSLHDGKNSSANIRENSVKNLLLYFSSPSSLNPPEPVNLHKNRFIADFHLDSTTTFSTTSEKKVQQRFLSRVECKEDVKMQSFHHRHKKISAAESAEVNSSAAAACCGSSLTHNTFSSALVLSTHNTKCRLDH